MRVVIGQCQIILRIKYIEFHEAKIRHLYEKNVTRSITIHEAAR